MARRAFHGICCLKEVLWSHVKLPFDKLKEVALQRVDLSGSHASYLASERRSLAALVGTRSGDPLPN